MTQMNAIAENYVETNNKIYNLRYDHTQQNIRTMFMPT
jgi:hypothetical protein